MASLAGISSFLPPTIRFGRCSLTSGFFLVAATLMLAQSGPRPEYDVKAAFLFNFVQFSEWPSEAFPDASAPLVVGVLGTDPFGDALDRAMNGERASDGRPIEVRRCTTLEQALDCQLLFVASSERGRLEPLLARLHGRRVLTVGELEGFADRGGAIQLTSNKGRVRFRVNLETVRHTQIKLSSQLLRHAETVGQRGTP